MINKVYVVVEEYFFDGTETELTIFDTFEKAKECFDKVVIRERTTSWVERLNEEEMEQEETYFHAYDNNDYYETTIYVVEKEIK